MAQQNFVEIRVEGSIQDAYDKYLDGIYQRNSKPWKFNTPGIILTNDKFSVHYTWDIIKEDIKRIKILNRKYFKVELSLDEQIWTSFRTIGIDLWDLNETKGTYGIQTSDGFQLDWDTFKELVENGQFEETPERLTQIKQFEENVVIESSDSFESDLYESI